MNQVNLKTLLCRQTNPIESYDEELMMNSYCVFSFKVFSYSFLNISIFKYSIQEK